MSDRNEVKELAESILTGILVSLLVLVAFAGAWYIGTLIWH